MTNLLLKPATMGLVLSVIFGAAGVNAQSTSGSSGSTDKAELKVGHVDYTKTMGSLVAAAQKLRESIQQLARHEPGPKRETAIDASRDALLLTQRAMLELPPELRVEDVKVREAKDWPKAMARLDSAGQKLRASVDTMSKQAAGKGRDEAIATVKKALAETEEAMLAIPEYNMKN